MVQTETVQIKGSIKSGPRRTKFPSEKVNVLFSWLLNNLHKPYPSEAQRDLFVKQTGFSARQITDWFINARRRKVPMLLLQKGIERDTFRRSPKKRPRSASPNTEYKQITELPSPTDSSLHFNPDDIIKQDHVAFLTSHLLSPSVPRKAESYHFAYHWLKEWEHDRLTNPSTDLQKYNLCLLTEAAMVYQASACVPVSRDA